MSSGVESDVLVSKTVNHCKKREKLGTHLMKVKLPLDLYSPIVGCLSLPVLSLSMSVSFSVGDRLKSFLPGHSRASVQA